MSQAFFQESEQLPPERARRIPDLDLNDAAFLLGIGTFAVGLALIWLPLALVIPGAMLMALTAWRALR